MIINPKIYNKEIILLAAYALLDKASIMVEGDPKKEIKVTFDSQERDIESLFQKELIKASVHENQRDNGQPLQDAFHKEALLSDITLDNDPLKVEDTKKIAVPWEEKYGTTSRDL